jgi:hypothetical protein
MYDSIYGILTNHCTMYVSFLYGGFKLTYKDSMAVTVTLRLLGDQAEPFCQALQL